MTTQVTELDTAKKVYAKILKLMAKHEDILCFDVESLKYKSEYHLFGIELKETHGLNIDPIRINSLIYNTFGDYMCICWWGAKHKRTISAPDCYSQPKDELLLKISFPTGPYLFGGDYPTEFFQKFFAELKSYKPKYTDSANTALYFSMDNASEIFNNFNAIFKKYLKLNDEDVKQRVIKKMEADLEKLKANS